MSTIFRVILSSASGIIVGSLLYSLIFSLIILILDKVDKSSGWAGVIQNPVLLASLAGIILGGVLGFLTGFIIGNFKITDLLKGAVTGFIVTECVIIIALITLCLIDFSRFNNFNSSTDSIISTFFLFFILTFLFLAPSLIMGASAVKLNITLYSILNLKNQK